MPAVATWIPTTHADYDTLKGKDVFSADGEKVGSIAEILHSDMEMPAARGRHLFLLDPGLMKDWFGGFNQVYLPESSIEAVGSDRVTLSLSAEQIKQRGQEWTAEPTGLKQYRRV
jgi:sporulation protein YlmC with PRC-barrel domain